MKPVLAPIQLNETSFNVIRLHQALAIFGYSVNEHEINENFAGNTTLEQTRLFQRNFKISFDQKFLVDQPTSLIINRELQSKGLLNDETCSFKVKGSVSYSNGQIARKQKLLAVDVDLKGAAVYRNIKNLTDLKANGGFQILEELDADNRGNYETIFDCSQFRQAERKKADVVVFALEGEEIIGRSKMVNSEQYSDTGEVAKLDVTILRILNRRTEYAIVMEKLNAFLRENQVTIEELSKSPDQVVFTARELDLDNSIIKIIINAHLLTDARTRDLNHELLYGIGRQNIPLRWKTLYKKQISELKEYIKLSIEKNIIQRFDSNAISSFLEQLFHSAALFVLDYQKTEGSLTLDRILSHTLPEREQRIAFLNATLSHSGDGASFWKDYLPGVPAFKDKPALVEGLLTLHQLTLITANHQPLVEELLKSRQVTSAKQLVELTDAEWETLLTSSGLPENLQGSTTEEKRTHYITLMKNILHAAFPTQKIFNMVKSKELPVKDATIATGIENFLGKTPDFDISSSRIYNFESQLRNVAPDNFVPVTKELKRIQRLFQISPNAEALKVLMESEIHSAHDISNFSEKSFIRTFSGPLGGEDIAGAVYQRSSFNSARSENFAMKMQEQTSMATPDYVLSVQQQKESMVALKNLIPNYSDLFGSPDICECDHCRSVYSPAAYFVDLLRFLWRGDKNADNKSPLDMLKERRPDLLHLPLTCENTHTIIPYIDLANEVMEYYTAHNMLDKKAAYDTGDTTSEELRASPQNFNIEAYEKLKDRIFPFTLPYHQPLDVIRTYSDHLSTSREDVMRYLQIDFSQTTERAISAEALRFSPEGYAIISGNTFNDQPDGNTLHAYFGYASNNEMQQKLKEVNEFLKRTGVSYTELIELIKTKFINQQQSTLDFLQDLFSGSEMSPSLIYSKLEQIENGSFSPQQNDPLILALEEVNISLADFTNWVQQNLNGFRSVITLYQPESLCDLNTTELRTVGNIYGENNSSINSWSKIHRFIRLWRRLGWSIHETDLMLSAMGEVDITPQTIKKLSLINKIKKETKKAINEIAVFWGNIDTYGNKSLYKKLFLNKAIQRIDPSFEADEWGNYLANPTEILFDHQPGILAAFRMSEEDLQAILETAMVIDNGNPRLLTLNDPLNLANLSILYRYVLLAKSLKLKVKDLCLLFRLFQLSPFSSWDVQQNIFISIDPENTLRFIHLAIAVKEAKFKPVALQYIFSGLLPAESTLGLNREKIKQTVRTIRESFASIEQLHTDTPVPPLTAETVKGKLSNTYQADVIHKLFEILDGTASFETITNSNLDINLPPSLSARFNYVKGSGRLLAMGLMTESEKIELKALPNVNPAFEEAVDRLFQMPETFILENFSDIFANVNDALQVLLNPLTVLNEKLVLLYSNYIPLLKKKLRQDAIVQHIASLIGLTEDLTAILINTGLPSLMNTLATQGFNAVYYSDINGSMIALERVDPEIDFTWNETSPDPAVPADNFSVRWNSYLAVPASGDYTLIVEVSEPDESFQLFLDDVMILEKTSGDAMTSWEIAVTLNSGLLHKVMVGYVELSQNAGVSLYWKTVTSSRQIIPSSFLYPTSIVDSFASMAIVYHRAAQFIAGFKLTERELGHFIRYNIDFDNIDFNALTSMHWQRINDYVFLRNRVPQAQISLIDIFSTANKPLPVPTIIELTDLVYNATAWDYVSLTHLIQNYFTVSQNDFKNEKLFLRVLRAIQLVQKTGISIVELAKWAIPETDFNNLNNTAQSVKSTVKAKYEEADWLSVAGGLSDKIRRNQQQALISYLLTRTELRNWGAVDADGLFEYFLIDVQMGACMDTSRIVQANSSVQMFVNRCLLNLESKKSSTGVEHGVSPSSIDADRWEWMKYYRVWEANRKVFLYPENWLEPEWRDDRSPFFKELESELVQNDITDRSVENAFRNYLTKLNGVANLEVCGSIQEYDDHNLPILYHVIGRTNTIPYQYYYRTWTNTYRKWTPWDKVGIDIRSVDEGDEDNDKSGVHLIPVIWKKRLFLFWPEFIKGQEESSMGNKTGWDTLNETVASFKSKPYWEVKLAWSEYIDGKWAPKQFTKECAYTDELHPKNLSYSSEVDETTQELTITGWITKNFSHRHYFTFVDIQSPVHIHYPEWKVVVNGVNLYVPSFMKIGRTSTLRFLDNDYLKKSLKHKLLFSNHVKDFEGNLKYPFFYTARKRSFFVRPISIRVVEAVVEPGKANPFLPGNIVDDSGWNIPIDIPDIGEDDRRDHVINFQDSGIVEMEVNTQFNSSMQGFEGEENVLRSGTFNSGSPITNRSSRQSSSEYETEAKMVGQAFGGLQIADISYGAITDNTYGALQMKKGLEFHTFYHPYSSAFVTRLNQGNVEGLLESDTVLPGDGGIKFLNQYQPDATYVPKQSDFKKRTYYKENVCFDVYGANSIYNWELFFHAPLYIATRLSKNGRFEEAMKWFHFIFNPTTDKLPKPGETEISRYWQVLPFKTEPIKDLQEWFMDLDPNNNPKKENLEIGEWRDDPFKPHLVARNRPIAYMKNVVIKYVQNLIDWADSLFRMDTMETVNESLQLYVIANHILGPRPQFVPKRGEIKAETYSSLKLKWDDFSNALVELENIFPYSSEIPSSVNNNQGNLLGGGPALYFCIPSNDKLLETWDVVADRLYKIRHCMNIDGVERKLALFAPPIDPAVLVNAIAQGLSLGSILADLSSPPPIYRFNFLMQNAKEFCGEVKSLGNALLSTLEKKDGEELNLLRSSHEIALLDIMSEIKERQVLESKLNRENIIKTRETAKFKVDHYVALLGKEALAIPDAPTISADLNEESELPADTNLTVQKPNVDESLENTEEDGIKILSREKEEMDKLSDANYNQNVASSIQLGSNAVLALLPSLDADGKPFGVGAGVTWGGSNLSSAANAVAEYFQIQASIQTFEGSNAAKFGNYIRREQDWTMQLNLALKEIIQIDKQITAADIRIQVAEKELAHHRKQIENSKEVELFLKNKFTNQELYQWMKEQLFAVYKQSYNMAYDLAKKTEKAYRYEIGNEITNFIQYGYWDNSKQGLLAGEKLQLAIQQMEKSYIEQNYRELELTKHISISMWNPLALQELKQTGKCFFTVPEELLDLDYQGHYFRRIKSVSISIPCIAGPHTSVNCTLRLLSNTIRVNTSMNNEGGYEHNNDEGAWIDDDRFRSNNVPVKSIATSSAQQDNGMFELNFRDDRYLPFEGAGAISNWKLELTMDPALRQFDYQTIADIIIHINYTAREDAGLFKEKTVEYLKNFLENDAENSKQPLMRMFSLKHEFSTEWHKFLFPAISGGEQILNLSLTKDHFPFIVKDRDVQVMMINVMAKTSKNGDYHLMLNAVDTSEEIMQSSQISMPQNVKYGNMQMCTLAGSTNGVSVEDLNIFSPISFKLKHSAINNYNSLAVNPEEVQDMLLVIHYKLVEL